MTHTHRHGELITEFFVAQENSNLTDGRGAMRDVGSFVTAQDAYNKIKGRAVQGCGDGDVVYRRIYRCLDCPELVEIDERVYIGDTYSKNNLVGKGNYSEFLSDGWRMDYSPLGSDPEFDEFVRLRKKFQNIKENMV